jgi:hypothetical protein
LASPVTGSVDVLVAMTKPASRSPALRARVYDCRAGGAQAAGAVLREQGRRRTAY